MPIVKGEVSAMRAVKGDPSLTSGTGADGFPYNVEFQRIYFGNDLKFDRLSSMYFYITNLGGSAVTVYLAKNGSNWSSTPSFKYILSSNLNTENTYAFNNGISIPAGGRVYFRNVGSNTFSESLTNYLRFSISGSSNVAIGGNWGALCPYISNANGLITQAAFIKMFYNCTRLQRIDNFPVNISEVHNDSFYSAFEGCTNLVSAPGMHVSHIMGYDAFYGMFRGCTSLTTVGDFTYETIESTSDQVFCEMFSGCSSLTVGPRLCNSNGVMAYSNIGSYSSTFYNCTSMTSVRSQYMAERTSVYVTSITIEEQVFSNTFAGCTAFTGTGLSFPSTMGDADCNDGIPLPETITINLLESSFDSTFNGCTSMTNIPACTVFNREIEINQTVPLHFVVRSERSLAATFKNTAITGAGGNINNYFRIEFIEVNESPNDYGCYQMFYGTPIVTANLIFYDQPIKYPSDYLCSEMFYGCTSLQTASIPPIHYTSISLYERMFYGCTNLTNPGSFLGESTAASRSLYGMFQGCTSLRISPVLPFITLEGNAYTNLFYGCSNLHVIVTAQSQQGSNTSNWTYGTPSSGIYAKINESNIGTTKNASGNTSNAHYIPYNWTISSNYLMFRSSSTSTVKLMIRKYGSPTSGTFSGYKVNSSGTITTLSSISVSTSDTFGSNNCVSIDPKGILLIDFTSTYGNFSTSTSDYYQFKCNTSTACLTCEGSTNALLKRSLTSNKNAVSYTFYRAFKELNAITCGPKIYSDTGRVSNSYRFCEMFYGCSNMLTCGTIETTKAGLMDFDSTFAYTSITSVPNLNNITSLDVSAFESAFYGSMIRVPQFPTNATTLANSCFKNMYNFCTNISSTPANVTIPVMPWTTLADECYLGLYEGCTGIKVVPDDMLPATTMQSMCYCNLFKECTNLVKAPKLPATQTSSGCYMGMFQNCTNLIEMNVSFTAWGNAWGTTTQRDTNQWTTAIQSTTGTFKCPSALPAYFNNSGNMSNSVSGSGNTDTSACYIPYGWTRITSSTVIPSDRCTFTYASGSAVTISPGTRSGALQYSRDGFTWYNFTSAQTINSSNKKICFRANVNSDNAPLSESESLFTTSGGKFDVSGCINYMYSQSISFPIIDASNLFRGNGNIRYANTLYFYPNTVVTADNMFRASTVVKLNVNLFAEVLVQHAEGMCVSCTSLTQAANLSPLNPIIPNGCFRNTYTNCTALISNGNDRTKWITIGSPNAYNDGDECFCGTFAACSGSNFNAVRVLSHYIAKRHDSGYSNWTFKDCFNGCSHLTKIEGRFCRWPDTSKTNNWCYGVPTGSSGTFYHTSEMTSFPHSVHRIPVGWNVTQVS